MQRPLEHWATTTPNMPVCRVTTSLGEVAIGASERIWFTSSSSTASRGDRTWRFATRSEPMQLSGGEYVRMKEQALILAPEGRAN